ncbi:MAG: primosomal protein N' [Acidiferrobacterales bacterium]
MTTSASVFRVAVPTPLRRCFDYIVPEPMSAASPGVRVRVPFGRRELVGVLIRALDESPVEQARLKSVLQILDREPVLSTSMLSLLQWAADYYHHPLGEVLKAALPSALRQGQDLAVKGLSVWSLTPAGANVDLSQLNRAPLQRRILKALDDTPTGLHGSQLATISRGWAGAIRQLVAKGWVGVRETELSEGATSPAEPAPALTAAQHAAVDAITASLNSFRAFLLHGVTGSGKTEVYLNVIAKVLAQQRQALLLVPEIGLTPQLVARVRARFPISVAVLHSGLSDRERFRAWLQARDARAQIVLGTRSAVFTPMESPGVIIVDEEHDTSYKQQEGFRYHARDIAVIRARRENIAIILGSATPSLDSLRNVAKGSYERLMLPDRTRTAVLPAVHLLDLRRLALNNGLSPPLLEQIGKRLHRGEQSLLFLNRRGYAPVYMCHDCGWLAPCARCDGKLTLHKHRQRLRCHHCGADIVVPKTCPDCDGVNLHALGEGTERIESVLANLFPRARVVRIDRDSTREKGALEQKLSQVDVGDADILVGTQMLSKGHDFPDVTLVGVLSADQGLYSVDFRASEQLFQQIMQVSGRAGRGHKPGEVWVQTYHPDHPLFVALCNHDYDAFAKTALNERREASYPPFSHFALLRAESPKPNSALTFVQFAHQLARSCSPDGIDVMEPLPSPMERRAGRYRAQLLLQSTRRRPLHDFLNNWLPRLETARASKRVRWSLDVDPIDMY